jgi:hypothetical protein
MSEHARPEEIEEGLVESALEEAGLPCKRREAGWVVPAGGLRLREIALTPESGGLRVEAVLASWDEISATQREALERFLRSGETGLRSARCEQSKGQALAFVLVAAGDLEAHLPHAVAAVLAAVRLLAREAGALLSTEVADAYLRFFAQGSEMAGATGRI